MPAAGTQHAKRERMWNFDHRIRPFGPEVKSQRIKDFLQEPEIANAPSHLEAYEPAEKRYRQGNRNTPQPNFCMTARTTEHTRADTPTSRRKTAKPTTA